MRSAAYVAPGVVRIDERPVPRVVVPTDVVVRVEVTCVCGSDLWAYRGLSEKHDGQSLGHEFVGFVTEVGEAVTSLTVGSLVIAPFTWNCGSCPECLAGVQGACRNGGLWGAPGNDGGQGEYVRVPHADATLVEVPRDTPRELYPHLLTLSDVLCTGYHAAVSAGVAPGHHAVVVGDGAVGLSGVLSARLLGAERVTLMSRNPTRQRLGVAFGATDVIEARGADAQQAILELTDTVGADSVLECVGTKQSVETAFDVARAGATVGFVGVPHGGQPPLERMFRKNIGLKGGIASARKYIPELLPSVLDGSIQPGLVFDAQFTLDEISEAYRVMDAREAIKSLVWVRPA